MGQMGVAVAMRCLTFELRRERRCGAWPAGRMMNHSGRRAKCHAGASRLQRRVRPHCLWWGAIVPTGDANEHWRLLLVVPDHESAGVAGEAEAFELSRRSTIVLNAQLRARGELERKHGSRLSRGCSGLLTYQLDQCVREARLAMDKDCGTTVN